MFGSVQVSVVVPTRNRPEKLRRVLSSLQAQSLARERFEIIVVDDGSEPPVRLVADASGPTSLIRLESSERSAARNRGATVAAGELVVFVDDDMLPGPSFLAAHLAAQSEWPGALAVGAVALPPSASEQPFGRFRTALERQSQPESRGVADQPNLCAAGNMSMPRARFLELGGFDPEMVSSEDQDLALRHTSRGGLIVFLPEAIALHDDDHLDIRSYCRRLDWGAANMIPFCCRHSTLPDNRLRVERNGPVRWGVDSAGLVFKKLLKTTFAWPPALETLFALTALAERLSANRALASLYRLLLGIHLQKGFRRGWAEEAKAGSRGAPSRITE
jgi:glycosyltransferase involved in cell wall biosynthesis